jgi:hypothetical protein
MRPPSKDLQESIRLLNSHRVTSRELLIRNKRAAGRDKDLGDIRLLE